MPLKKGATKKVISETSRSRWPQEDRRSRLMSNVVPLADHKPLVPIDLGEAREAEQWWVERIGQGLRARLWGQGIQVVLFEGSSVNGWRAACQRDSGRVIDQRLSLDGALALDNHQGDREHWADLVIEFLFEQLMIQLAPPAPEPSENDMVSQGFIGDIGLGQVELHPDVANKLGDLKHEIHQQITGRKL